MFSQKEEIFEIMLIYYHVMAMGRDFLRDI